MAIFVPQGMTACPETSWLAAYVACCCLSNAAPDEISVVGYKHKAWLVPFFESREPHLPWSYNIYILIILHSFKATLTVHTRLWVSVWGESSIHRRIHEHNGPKLRFLTGLPRYSCYGWDLERHWKYCWNGLKWWLSNVKYGSPLIYSSCQGIVLSPLLRWWWRPGEASTLGQGMRPTLSCSNEGPADRESLEISLGEASGKELDLMWSPRCKSRYGMTRNIPSNA